MQEMVDREKAAEGKVTALSEIHQSKTKALLRSINLLKKEIASVKYENQDSVKHKRNEQLQEEMRRQEVAIRALRKLVGDEDGCNTAITESLKKAPTNVKVLSREQLKMEIRKHKNISLKLLKDMKAKDKPVPGYAASLAKQADSKTSSVGVGMKRVKEEGSSLPEDFEDQDMFGEDSDGPANLDDVIPLEVQTKITQLEDRCSKMNLDLKDKNEKILELLSELEDVKIEVFARDKSLELQKRQVEELLEELKESRGLENDVRILVQKNMVLEEDTRRLKDEAENNFREEADGQNEAQELIMIVEDLKL